MKSIIVAIDRNLGIGKDGDLIWQRDLPGDLQRFKTLTAGNAIIMGRVTFFFDLKERILPNRQTIIVSHQNLDIPGATVVGSLEEAYKAVEKGRDIFVIGGAQIYQQAINDMDRLYVTEVNAIKDADTFFLEIDHTQWQEVSREHHVADNQNKYDFDWVTYDRITPRSAL